MLGTLIGVFPGIGFVVVAMGLYGFSEIIANLERREKREVVMAKITSLMPTRQDFPASWNAVLRGTGIGALLGILRLGGAVLALVLRPVRLSVHQAGLRTSAVASRLCARTEDGRQSAARDFARTRPSGGVRYSSAEPCASADCIGIARCGRASNPEKKREQPFLE